MIHVYAVNIRPSALNANTGLSNCARSQIVTKLAKFIGLLIIFEVQKTLSHVSWYCPAYFDTVFYIRLSMN
jgi:hypothetical protein